MIDRLEQVLSQRRRLNRLYHRRFAIGVSVSLHGLVLLSMIISSILAAIEKPPQYVDVMIVTPEAMAPPPPRQQTTKEPVKEPDKPPEIKPPEPEQTVLPDPEPEPVPDSVPRDPEPQPAPPDPTPPREAEPEEGSSSESGPPVENAREGPVRISGFDDPTFDYGYYVDRMVASLRENWLRPPVGNDVECIVHFYIAADGTVEALEMVTPSGITSFDMASMRAVRSATLPPLPRSYRRARLGVTLIFR